MTILPPLRRDRLVAAIGAAALQGLILYALIVGLSVGMPTAVTDGLKLFGVFPASPPPPPVTTIPHRVASKRPKGAAAPPNLRSKATEIVAPPPIVRTIVPSPVVVALTPGTGADSSTGASDVRGSGTGGGGVGEGTGSGGVGDGDGAGGDETGPRWRKGRLRDSDYPRDAAEAGIGGTVSVRYTVGVDGRVTACKVARSSGSAELDETTCRLIRQRFRFDPSRDARGRPVPSIVVESHSWEPEAIAPSPPNR